MKPPREASPLRGLSAASHRVTSNSIDFYRMKLDGVQQERELWLSRLEQIEQTVRSNVRTSMEVLELRQRLADAERELQAAREARMSAAPPSSLLAFDTTAPASLSTWPSAMAIAERVRRSGVPDAGTGAPPSLQSAIGAASPGMTVSAHVVNEGAGQILRTQLASLSEQLEAERASAAEARDLYCRWRMDIEERAASAAREADAKLTSLVNDIAQLQLQLRDATKEYLLLRHTYHINERKAVDAVVSAVAARKAAELQLREAQATAAVVASSGRDVSNGHARALSSFVAIASQQAASDLRAQAVGYEARIAALTQQLEASHAGRMEAKRQVEAAEEARRNDWGTHAREVQLLRRQLRDLTCATHGSCGRQFDLPGVFAPDLPQASEEGSVRDGRADFAVSCEAVNNQTFSPEQPHTQPQAETRGLELSAPRSVAPSIIYQPSQSELRPQPVPSSVAALTLVRESANRPPGRDQIVPSSALNSSLTRLRAKRAMLSNHPILYRNVRSTAGVTQSVRASEVNARARSSSAGRRYIERSFLDSFLDAPVASDPTSSRGAHAPEWPGIASDLQHGREPFARTGDLYREAAAGTRGRGRGRRYAHSVSVTSDSVDARGSTGCVDAARPDVSHPRAARADSEAKEEARLQSEIEGLRERIVALEGLL